MTPEQTISDEARKLESELTHNRHCWNIPSEGPLAIIQRHMTAYAITYHAERSKELVKLLEMVPRRPNAITWEVGVELLNILQALAEEHAARKERE